MDNQQPSPPPPQSPQPVTTTPVPSHHRMKLMTIGFIAVLLLAAFGFGGYVLGQQSSNSPIPYPTGGGCMEDARICEDGSKVGRVAPKCEFAACPAPKATSSADTTYWRKYTNEKEGYELLFPPTYMITLQEAGRQTNQPLEVNINPIPQSGVTPYEEEGLFLNSGAGSEDVEPELFNLKKQIDGLIDSTYREGDKEINVTCAVYSRRAEIVDICNKIMSTFRFTNNPTLEGRICGGYKKYTCASGYSCELFPMNYQDRYGTCIKN